MDIVPLCHICNGTGWVVTVTDDPYDDDRPEVERCPACRGFLERVEEKAPVLTGEKEGTNPSEGEV